MSLDPASVARTTNDAGLPVQAHYPHAEPLEHPALHRWREDRLARGWPYRPDWKIYVGHGSPEFTARRLGLLQRLGVDSLLLAWDLPSQLGLDPDHRLARSQVGRAGVSCASLDDMRAIWSEVDLSRLTSLGLLANSVGPYGYALALEVLEESGSTGTSIMMQNDPLKEFTARGTDLFQPAQALRLACDVVEYAVEHDLPGHAITVSSNHFDVAGAGPVLALAFALSNGIAYLDDLVDRGLDAATAAQKIALFINERSDFMLTAALFRTARVLWADLLADRYAVPDSQPPVHIMGYAHGLEHPAEPLVNVARVAVSVTAASLGGADTLCAAAYDEALRIPSEDAAALALRTIQVASLEHGISDSIDSLAGSYKFETMSREIQRRVRDEMRRVDQQGGAVACIDNDYLVDRMLEWQSHRPTVLESGERPWLGVNQHQSPNDRHLFAGASSPDLAAAETETRLIDRVRARKAAPAPGLDRALQRLTADITGRRNCVPATRAALREGATVEQITEATRAGLDAAAEAVSA
jgi:methylmalonyl-CoA mutase N-terminal domain/subunit